MKAKTKILIGVICVIIVLILISILFPKEQLDKNFKPNLSKEDSIHHLNMVKKIDSIKQADSIQFINSKAGKIWLKHKNWSREDCFKLFNGQIWVGMTLDMVKFLRGLPDHVNKSNYGNGDQYQWCWDEYTPSCFYGKADGIITGYN